jgi:hypothetical protein
MDVVDVPPPPKIPMPPVLVPPVVVPPPDVVDVLDDVFKLSI